MMIHLFDHDNVHIYSWWHIYLLMMIYISAHDDIHICSWWYTYLLLMIYIFDHDNIHIWYFQKCMMDNPAYEDDLKHNNNNTKDAEVGYMLWKKKQYSILNLGKSRSSSEWRGNKEREEDYLQECSSYLCLLPPAVCGFWVHVQITVIYQYSKISLSTLIFNKT